MARLDPRNRSGVTRFKQVFRQLDSDRTRPVRGGYLESPLDELRVVMKRFRFVRVPGLPRFTGGAVGYLGYDAAAWFEPVMLQPEGEIEDDHPLGILLTLRCNSFGEQVARGVTRAALAHPVLGGLRLTLAQGSSWGQRQD